MSLATNSESAEKGAAYGGSLQGGWFFLFVVLRVWRPRWPEEPQTLQRTG